MAYKACYRNADISPTKVRSIATMIRGKQANEALDSLKFLPNRGARMLEKVLRSAMANAEEQGARGLESLKVVEARVDEGPRMKRIQPHARGMAFPILKRLCHIHVSVDAS